MIMRSIIFLPCLIYISSLHAGDWSGYIGIEERYFLNNHLDAGQHDGFNLSFSIEAEYYHDWNNGDDFIAFTPYFRLDQHDNERTHFDIRELTYVKVTDVWELRLGIRKVFWGVTEFQHLVDIINQTDLVENIDGEDKLGQPMVNLALIRNWGTIDLFVMPYFRERNFPNQRGRLRNVPLINKYLTRYESAAEENHVDFAVRYSHVIGDIDFGLSHFYGTSREPRLVLPAPSPGNRQFAPFYDIINQTSLDAQATTGNMLWKLETLHRSGQLNTYNAIAAGLEYTFVGVLDTAMDVGVLSEYHFDDRHDSAVTIFNNDMAIGTRLSINDAQSSEVLAGLIWDHKTGGKFLTIEAGRRFGSSWFLELQARLFIDQTTVDTSFSLRNDDYIELFLTWNF